MGVSSRVSTEEVLLFVLKFLKELCRAQASAGTFIWSQKFELGLISHSPGKELPH